MDPLSPTELEASWAEIEAAVDRTAEIDRWCSGPDWVLPAHAGFGLEAGADPQADAGPLPLRLDTPAGPGFALLAAYRTTGGQTVIGGLEPLWGFASALVGGDIGSVTAGLAEHLRSRWDWRALVLAGMPATIRPGSFTPTVAGELVNLGPVRTGKGIVRQVADLADGHDAWFARRSSRFRQRLRQSARQAAHAGLGIVDISTDDDLFARLLAIEGTSWKGHEGSGITSPEMLGMYRAMIARLQSRGRARAYVARLGGEDVGYIVGGVRSGIYRGLQISYRTDVAPLSVGHLLQWHQISALCQCGEAVTYDLGMDLGYKRRWADRAERSLTLVVEPDRRSRDPVPKDLGFDP